MQSEKINLSLQLSYFFFKSYFRNYVNVLKNDGRGREYVLLSVITAYRLVVKNISGESILLLIS